MLAMLPVIKITCEDHNLTYLLLQINDGSHADRASSDQDHECRS
jgi:hypothetical protein